LDGYPAIVSRDAPDAGTDYAGYLATLKKSDAGYRIRPDFQHNIKKIFSKI
jgi:hypothetical protein